MFIFTVTGSLARVYA